MMLGSLEAEGARHFCIEHGCNHNICSGKPSGSDAGVKMDDADDMDEDHDHDTDIDLWGSGGATQWGKDEDEYDAFASGVNKWSKDEDEDEVDSDRDGAASASAILPSRSRQRQQRGLAWSPPNWGAPKYTEPKPYYQPPTNNYYPPSAPTPYYPAAPEFVETCCSSNERVCPMDFPMQKQVLLSGKVRVCCFTSRVNGGGGYSPYSYGYGGGGYYRGGGGGYQYQAQTSPRYGGGYGNRKLQYGYAYGRGGTYGQQPSYYGDSYAFGGGLPAQCPATPLPTPVPSPAPSMSSQPSACFDKKLWTFEPPDNAFPNPPDWTNGDCKDLNTNLVVPCDKNWAIKFDKKDTGIFSLKSPSLDGLGSGDTNTYRGSARLTVCPTSPARALRFRVFPGAVRPFDRLVVLVDGVEAFQVNDANKIDEEWTTVPSAGGFALTAGGHTIDFQYEFNPFGTDLPMVPVDPDRVGTVWIDNVELL